MVTLQQCGYPVVWAVELSMRSRIIELGNVGKTAMDGSLTWDGTCVAGPCGRHHHSVIDARCLSGGPWLTSTMLASARQCHG